jgi:Cu/Ag efflux pump CusA
MIRRLVDFSLDNRFLVLAAAILLLVWGAISFHQLPVEAYPDVANNYVEIITQWPGISAEQIEQQVTIPLEIVMNGIPHVTHLRSFSIFGLSDLKLIFDKVPSCVVSRPLSIFLAMKIVIHPIETMKVELENPYGLATTLLQPPLQACTVIVRRS